MADVALVSGRAPAWVERLLRDDVRQGYKPERCPKPCPAFLRRSRAHVLLLRRSTMLPRGAHLRTVARSRLRDGMAVTFYAYRSEAGHLCDYVVVTAGVRPVSASLTPGLPCVPGAPCGSICLTQLHCCGTNVVVGTVTTRADTLATRYDEGREVRYRLTQPAFRDVPSGGSSYSTSARTTMRIRSACSRTAASSRAAECPAWASPRPPRPVS